MTSRVVRIAPELHQLIKDRCQFHNTKFVQESRNIVSILKEMQPITGDIKLVPVIRRPQFPQGTIIRVK